MAFSVAVHSRRLLEIRIDTMLRPEETPHFVQELLHLLGTLPGRSLAMTDLRAATKATDPQSIDTLANLLRAENPRLERNAILLAPDAATVQMQIERLVKAGGSSQRRLFRARADAEGWLGETMTDGERARLGAFLDEGGAG